MKIAILLSGLHYITPEIVTDTNSPYLDFRQYTRNIQEYIYKFFQGKGYDTDTFICTQDSILYNELVDIYKPIRLSCISNTEDRRISKSIEVLRLFKEYIRVTNVAYDMVCLTRFDIYFLRYLINIDYTKINIISKIDTNLIDDNFYLFPISMLNEFFEMFSTNRVNMNEKWAIARCFLPKFEEKFKVHFIHDEKRLWPIYQHLN